MSINYPSSLDVLTNPVATDAVATVDHASQHSNANDAIEALEAKVGADGSVITTSHDYKLQEVTGSDVAVGKSASQTLTNKTLTTPTISSFANANHNHQDSAGGGTLNASSVFSAGTVPTARLGSGSANSTTYLRGDQQWTTVSGVGSSSLVIPTLAIPITTGLGNCNATTVSMSLGLFNIPTSITVNKVTYQVPSHSGNGTFKMGLYPFDGSSLTTLFTSSTITSTGTKTETITPVSISPGQYYIGIVMVSGTFQISSINTETAWGPVFSALSGKGIVTGTYTCTAGTLPATIDPTSIGTGAGRDVAPAVRFDN